MKVRAILLVVLFFFVATPVRAGVSDTSQYTVNNTYYITNTYYQMQPEQSAGLPSADAPRYDAAVWQPDETIRITRLKYDCYRGAGATDEYKAYADNPQEAERMKKTIGWCRTTGDAVSDPKYVIRYRSVSGADTRTLERAYLTQDQWLMLSTGCYCVDREGDRFTRFQAVDCDGQRDGTGSVTNRSIFRNLDPRVPWDDTPARNTDPSNAGDTGYRWYTPQAVRSIFRNLDPRIDWRP